MKFKVGDTVKCIKKDNYNFVRLNDIGIIVEETIDKDNTIFVKWNNPIEKCEDSSWWVSTNMVEIVK